MLGIRAAWKEDFQGSSAELVYGQPLRLPCEFLDIRRDENSADNSTISFVKELRQHVRNLKPCDGTRHGTKKTFVFKNLATSEQVFVRQDAMVPSSRFNSHTTVRTES